MPKLEAIKKSIREIAGRPNNVTLSEIETLVGQLERHGYTVNSRVAGNHAVLFGVNGRKFSIATHHKGAKQIKACYVKNFLEAMMDLALYE